MGLSWLLWVRLIAVLPVFWWPAYVAGAEAPGLSGFAVRNWDVESGLPQGAVRSVARTEDGYLWLGMSSGLARFDGARFALLTTNQIPPLKSNGVTALTLSPKGELWVGDAAGGVVHRHEGRFEAVEPALPQVAITAISVATDGSLWIGTDGRGLFWMHDGRTEIFTRSNGLPSNSIGQLAHDTNGKLWALVGGRLGSIEQGQWRPAPGDDASRPLYAIAPAHDGSLWVGAASENLLTDRGARVFRFVAGELVEELQPYLWPFDSRRSRITAVLEDGQGRVWVGNGGAGVFCWTRGAGWQRVAPETPLAQPEVTALVEDTEGLLWLVSRRAELFRITERLVMSLRLPPEAEENVINTVCARRDGSLWIGTDGAGVFRWQGERFTQLTNGLPTLHVASILEDRQTNLWVGTWNGLQQWRGDEFKDVPGIPALREVVLSLFQDSKQRLWASTALGLVCILPDGSTKLYGKSEGIDHTYIRGLAEDRQGRICVAIMDRGLYRQKDDRFERVAAGHWSGAAAIRALHVDAEGALWIATFGEGLFQFRNERFRQWAGTDGLPNLRLHTIMEDTDGDLWISSDNGIFGCSRRTLDAQPARAGQPVLFRQLSTPEGMDSKVCSGSGQPVAAQTADGRLWFPNRRALAVFDPQRLPRTAPAWPALIEEVLVNGEPVPDLYSGKMSIVSGQRRLEFRFTSPNLKAPDRMRFRHRLQGYDEDWQEDGDRREATYTHLPPGHYQFHAMAGGPDGVWHQTPKPFAIEVVPQFFERRAVQAASAFLLLGSGAGIVWGVSRARLRRRLAHIEAQQAMEHERRRIARDLHDDLGAGLAEVVLLGELARADEVTAEEMKAHVTDMTEKTRQLVTAMDEIVWTVNPRNDSIPNLASYLAEHGRKFFSSTPIHCRLDIMPDLPSLPVPAAARHNLFLAVKEALHNVVKHSGAREIWLRMRWSAGEFTLEVQDDGRGFDPNKLTERGDGLGNMRHRLEAVGGRAWIESQPRGGTIVRFDLPVPETGAESETAMRRGPLPL